METVAAADSAHDLDISSVDERSESGTSFPEGGTSFEDVVMHHDAHILRVKPQIEKDRLQVSEIISGFRRGVFRVL
jgi:hypothetical protein